MRQNYKSPLPPNTHPTKLAQGPFLIRRDGAFISRDTATLEEGQFALDGYIARYGYYPKAFPDGVFTTPASETSSLSSPSPPPSAPPTPLSTTLSQAHSPRMQTPEERTNELHQLEVQAAQARIANEAEYQRARIAALALPYTAVPQARAEDTEGETASPEILKLASQMVGISHTHLISIHKNKFVAENLSKLRIGRVGEGSSEEDSSTQLVFEGGIMVSKKLRGTLKDFGHNIDIWSEGFHNYMIANCVLYSTTFPNLLHGMLRFYNKIASLAKVYTWSGAVLNLAIHYQNHIMESGKGLTFESWSNIPSDWVDTWCSSTTVRTSTGTLAKKSNARPSITPAQPGASALICNNFNVGRCSSSSKDCIRQHICLTCKGDHAVIACTSK